jgi:hypothetical protein
MNQSRKNWNAGGSAVAQITVLSLREAAANFQNAAARIRRHPPFAS